jgi:V/A-type H+-transporting ATPase subunit C
MKNPFESSIAFRALSFGYANSRVKAMKTSLLSDKDLKAMASAKTVEDVYALLEKTPYRDDLVAVALSEKSLPDKIEIACTRNFSRTLGKVYKISPKEAKPKISAWFERYDANNIKIILLGKHLGQKPEEIKQFMIEGGSLSKGLIEKAVAAKSLKDAIIEFGGTEYGRVLERAYLEYEKGKQIGVIINAVDNHFFKRIPETAKKSFTDSRLLLNLIKVQIDSKNISNLLRLKKEDASEDMIMKNLSSGGKIGKSKLKQAASAKSVEEAAKFFEKEFQIGRALEEYKKTGSIIPFETAVEKSIGRKALAVLRVSVLSIGAIIGFLLLKEEEIANIRKIVRAKEFNLPVEKLEELMGIA